MKPVSAKVSDVPELSRSKRLQIISAVALGTFMGPLDASVVNIALPSITNHFNASLSTVEWVIMAYLLIISSLLLTYGRLGDMYGHKRIYVFGFIVFTIGSLLCGFAPSIILLIIFRAFQAIGAGMLMAIGPAIVTDVAPPQERGKFLGVIAIAVSVALFTGPILGGFLTGQFGWQSIFLINIPIGLIGSIWAHKIIPASKGHENQHFDILGAVLFFLALISILYSLSDIENVGWNNSMIIGLLALGVILIIAFLWIESRVTHPMVDLSLFKIRIFTMGNLSALFNFMAQYAVIFIMPFYLQQLRGLSPAQAGLILIPMPLVTMVIAPISGSLSDHFDSRTIRSFGMAITTTGLFLLSNLTISSSVLSIMLRLGVIGFGVGTFQTPNNSAVLGYVPHNRRGIASSMLATMRNMGMVLGVAISGAVFTSHENYLNKILSARGLSGPQLFNQSFTGAMHLTYSVSAALALIAVFTSFVRRPQNKH
ncbi:MAG: MFS transporter [Desulfosporosinus sp.]|nr:MFS transporter [Desulfosporosinus sp.]